MEHLKALKNILTNGKKRAYFENSPIERAAVKVAKMTKETDISSLFRTKPVIKLSKIQTLEKRLKEGIV